MSPQAARRDAGEVLGRKRKMRIVRGTAILVATAALLLAAGASQALATTVHCGDTITHSVKLDSDLVNCPGDGLVVGASKITINLNGHTVDGVARQSGVGISNNRSYDNVVVKRGVVSDFSTGILVVGASKPDLDSMHLRDNGIFGISLVNSDSTLVRRTSVERSIGGVLVDGGTGGRFVGDSLSGNSSYGIQLSRSSANTVRSTTLTGNAAGLLLTRGANANTLERNSLFANGLQPQGLTPTTNSITLMDSSNNRVEHNVVQSDTDSYGAFVIESDANSIVGNQITGKLDAAMLVRESAFNLIVDNSMTTPGLGIDINCLDPSDADCLHLSHDNSVTGNLISGGGIGLFLQNTHDNTFTSNRVTRENPGVSLAGSVAHNIFRGNAVVSNGGTGIVLAGDYGGASDGNQFIENEVSDNLGDGLRSEANHDGSETYIGTLFQRNVFDRNRDDGLRLAGASNTVSFNRADDNGKLGIEAVPGVTDGGDNTASGNGDPRQCVNVSCSTTGKPKGRG